MPSPHSALSRRLQDVTETLASATTEEAVFDVVLHQAAEALYASAATVLLRTDEGQALHVDASVGYKDGQMSIWHHALMDDDGPAADALTRRTPLFFEHDRDLARAYPHVEERTGAVAPVAATAVVPMFLDGEPLGVLVIDFTEPHAFTEEEQHFLRILAAQCAMGFGRARLLRSLEAQVAARTAALAAERDKLQSANEELEAFAYSVSHDLRTPVRHVASFATLLRKSLAERLDEKSNRHLQIIEAGAARMNRLIDAMVDLSRTARLPLHIGVVDLRMQVQEARDELLTELTDRVVQWEVQPLPLVMGDHATLQQVLTSLLANALKYSRNEKVAQIRVWAEERETSWAIFIQDNGVGFDSRYASKLFGVFQRLHSHEEFEGTGVGLANVRRIVHRHGGEVDAVGEVGAGATFSFTLPKPP